MSKTSLRREGWARCLGDLIFWCSKESGKLFFSIFLQIYFGIVYIWRTYHNFDEKIWFTVIFFLSNRSASCLKYDFFVKLSYNLFQFFLWIELLNLIPTICLGLSIFFLYAPAHKVWLTFEKFIFELEAFSHNFEINSILVRQLKLLRKRWRHQQNLLF